jgi:hypothetical protein
VPDKSGTFLGDDKRDVTAKHEGAQIQTKRIAPAVVLAAVIGMPAAISQTPTNKLPTATEVFHLRSECAALGEKILENSAVGSALTRSQVSHCDPVTNRCYVEIDVQTADQTKPVDYLHRYLYDGQTGEMLATTGFDHGKKSNASVFVRGHHPPLTGNMKYDAAHEALWSDAATYIDKMMADDRGQPSDH